MLVEPMLRSNSACRLVSLITWLEVCGRWFVYAALYAAHLGNNNAPPTSSTIRICNRLLH